MLQFYNKLISFISIFSVFLLISCVSNEKDDNGEKVKKKRINPNAEERAAAIRDQGGGIFNSSRKSSTTYEFATSNVLWRASLNSLEDIPLNQVDYSGGIIVSDWYSPKKSNESVKINIRFLSNELSYASIKITSFKKSCDTAMNCSISKMGQAFNNSIKDTILKEAKDLKIKDEELKKKK